MTTNQNFAAIHVPTLRERFWRKMGFRFHLGEEPDGTDAMPGWSCTNIHLGFSVLDRLRMMLTGDLRVTLIMHTDTPTPDVIKTRTDWMISRAWRSQMTTESNIAIADQVLAEKTKSRAEKGEVIGGGFIVAQRRPSGKLVVAHHPFEHPDAGTASTEALRLAALDPCRTFVVMSQIEVVVCQREQAATVDEPDHTHDSGELPGAWDTQP